MMVPKSPPHYVTKIVELLEPAFGEQLKRIVRQARYTGAQFLNHSKAWAGRGEVGENHDILKCFITSSNQLD